MTLNPSPNLLLTGLNPEESCWQRERKELLTDAVSIAYVQQFAERSCCAISKADLSRKRHRF